MRFIASDAVTKHYWVANPHLKKGRSVGGGGGGGGGGGPRHFPPQPEKFCGKIYHNGVGVLSSSTYKTDLLADKPKKKGGGGEGWGL